MSTGERRGPRNGGSPPADDEGTGPDVVAVGGGHGLAATLRALRLLAGRITAVVAVADDGGSSGRLRRHADLPAPGDLRRCISALADPDSLWGRAIEHRFRGGDLDDHALGNLVLYGLAEVSGDFLRAADELQRLVHCQGRVLPATVEPVTVAATLLDGGRRVEGQVAVASTGPVDRLELVPPDAAAPAEAVRAILGADAVVLGPGSLFTSVLAAALVPEIGAALAETAATRIWIANLRAQPHETTGFTLADHVDALARHGVTVDVVLRHPGALDPGPVAVPVKEAPVADDRGLVHDPGRLAAALAGLIG